jgi:hypothetical protein
MNELDGGDAREDAWRRERDADRTGHGGVRQRRQRLSPAVEEERRQLGSIGEQQRQGDRTDCGYGWARAVARAVCSLIRRRS